MTSKAAVTIRKPRDQVQRLWNSSDHRPRYVDAVNAAVTFTDAPGDRGTEIHVDLGAGTGGGSVAVVRGVFGIPALAKAKDDLRRFKQYAETGEIARSDAAPEGEKAERKLRQRPAQPLDEREREMVGVR